MIIQKERKEAGMIKCTLCGYSFAKGQKTFCGSCPLNFGNCHFEKCPNCGYDIPQRSYLWTLMVQWMDKLKKMRRK